MLDTIGLKIPISHSLLERVKKCSVEVEKYDNVGEKLLFRYYSDEVNLPSWDRHINVFLNDTDLLNEERYLKVEFSLPKFKYGHNIYLFYPEELPKYLNKLHDLFTEEYGEFPPIETWNIERLDLCYAWALPTQNYAQEILNSLRSFYIPKRKRPTLHDDAIFSPGTRFTLKYYLKANEFGINDFKEIKKYDPARAYHLKQLAQGILRFEVTYHKAGIRRYLLRKEAGEFLFTFKDITRALCEKLLKKHHYQFIRASNGDFMTDKQIMVKITDHCQDHRVHYKDPKRDAKSARLAQSKAANLFMFYIARNTTDGYIKSFLGGLHKSTISRHNKALKDAGVSLRTSKKLDKLVNLNIPSELASDDPAGAEAPSGGGV